MATTPPPPPDRDLTDPVDAALAGALTRAGQDLSEVPSDVARGHLEAITTEAVAHAHVAPMAQRGPGASWIRWRLHVRRLAGMTAVKIALGAGVAAAGTTGGLAATGSLPDPVQQVVSDGAAWVGIRLPTPAADEAEDVVEGGSDDGTTDGDSGDEPGETRQIGPPSGPVGPGDDAPVDRSRDRDAPAEDVRPDTSAESSAPAGRPPAEPRPGSPDPPHREDPPASQDRPEDPPADRPAEPDGQPGQQQGQPGQPAGPAPQGGGDPR